MAIITISRQLGALGNDIAQGLAEQLNYTLLSKEIISKMLLESGFSEEESIDTFSAEKQPSFLNSFILDRDKFICYIEKVIYEFAQKIDVIIMGMGGQLLFQDFPNPLRLRIIAPTDVRIKRVQETHACDDRYAMYLMHESDQARSGFNTYFFNIDWEAINLYDLIISTSTIPLQGAIRMIKEVIQELDNHDDRQATISKLKDLVLRQNVLIRILYEAKIVLQYMNVEVHNGIVTLRGFSKSEEDKESCEAAVREIPGVQEIVNEIIMEPATFR